MLIVWYLFTATCKKGYFEHSGTCYKVHTEKKNWMGAIVECGKENAVLSNIPSAAAESAIFAKANKAVTWIGKLR